RTHAMELQTLNGLNSALTNIRRTLAYLRALWTVISSPILNIIAADAQRFTRRSPHEGIVQG
ncbi:MAG: hypothetical protein QM682_16395, partial [Paracoccus sp. (in: a-proteobacteria)]|uniref:hypothetical protein n=1 Tax=Paracoccus sp. TaxID=267 RepID=UPI0039E65B00